jgi:hypothetical protein
MLIRESRLREIVRSVLRENDEIPVDLDLTDDLEFSEDEVEKYLSGAEIPEGYEFSEAEVKEALDDLDLTDDLEFDADEVEAAYQASRNAQVQARNVELASQYLLKMKGQSPQVFKELAKQWVPYVGNQKAGMVQWMKALESGEVQSQLSYSKIDKYRDLSQQFLKNPNWKAFAKWYLILATTREISTDPYKIADPSNRTVTADTIKVKNPGNRTVTADTIKVKNPGNRTVTADTIKIKKKKAGSGRMMAY